MTRTVSIRLTRDELEAVLQALVIARVEGYALAPALGEPLARACAKLTEGRARVQARNRRALEAKVDAADRPTRNQTATKTATKAGESL